MLSYTPNSSHAPCTKPLWVTEEAIRNQKPKITFEHTKFTKTS